MPVVYQCQKNAENDVVMDVKWIAKGRSQCQPSVNDSDMFMCFDMTASLLVSSCILLQSLSSIVIYFLPSNLAVLCLFICPFKVKIFFFFFCKHLGFSDITKHNR